MLQIYPNNFDYFFKKIGQNWLELVIDFKSTYILFSKKK